MAIIFKKPASNNIVSSHEVVFHPKSLLNREKSLLGKLPKKMPCLPEQVVVAHRLLPINRDKVQCLVKKSKSDKISIIKKEAAIH